MLDPGDELGVAIGERDRFRAVDGQAVVAGGREVHLEQGAVRVDLLDRAGHTGVYDRSTAASGA